MRILILSFYYPPDLSAGSFRSDALVKALLEFLPDNAHIEVITTLPNRYDSFTDHANILEQHPRLTIHRVQLPLHRSGMLAQAMAFLTYARKALGRTDQGRYDLVYGTSSRLMTAALSARIAQKKRLPLYLDVRDIFVDTIKDVLPGRIAWLAKPLFSAVERWTIAQADSVNLVSLGFRSYFSRRYPDRRWSYYTNGIDDEFLQPSAARVRAKPRYARPMLVLYAGNIGEGQGLDSILPALAKRLGNRVTFRVIGDGGRRSQLENELTRVRCTNVEIVPPMKRDRLIDAYRQADVLFLHLNDYPAFKKVLPSKLFEYAATGKPIWAGVAGYASCFVKEEIENAVVFGPCDVDDAVRTLDDLILEEVPRSRFVAKYARAQIMNEMASDIAKLLPSAFRKETTRA